MLYTHDACRLVSQDRAGEYPAALDRLLKEAKEAMEVDRLSVVDNPRLPASGDPHDYYSIAPYSHPNPDTPDGLPYINRDGIFNPEFEECDRRRMDKICSYTRKLTLAYLATRDPAYREHAVRLLRCFFLDPETRMNPHMEYAQEVRGVCTGRGIGIIDLRYFYRMLDMVKCLDDAELEKELREYFSRLLDWLRDSQKGHDEFIRKNNHGTWYDVTCTALALFVGREELAREILSGFADRRIATQVAEDGSLPLELRRTRSFLYSTMNLFGFFTAARMAKHLGLDLFGDDRLRSAFVFMLPYYADYSKWPYPQIAGNWEETWEMAYEMLLTSAEEYGIPECREIAAAILEKEIPDSDIPFLYA